MTNLTRKFDFPAGVLLSLLFTSPLAAAADSGVSHFALPYGVNGCAANTGRQIGPAAQLGQVEKWVASDGTRLEWSLKFPKEFQLLLSGKGSKVVSFSEALSSRRLATTELQKAFSEYWLARTLLASGLTQLAYQGFSVLVDRDVVLETLPVQLASLECLSEIHTKYPAFALSGRLVSQLVAMNRELTQNIPGIMKVLGNTIQELTVSLMLSKEVSASRPGSSVWYQGLGLLKGKGAYESLASGVFQASLNSHSEASRQFEKFFSDPESERPFFKPYFNQARLLFGRSLFGQGKYHEAAQQYKLISPRSNEWVHALSELSWAHFMDDKYQEAIGTAIGMQAGAFKQTFSPEVLMVMAMALNEICRFPESMNVIKNFRARYRDTYQWLKGQNHPPQQETLDYYREAIAFARKSPQVRAPALVASEWIRSPIFIASQERINLGFEEKKLSNLLGDQGKREQRELTLRLIASLRKLRGRYHQERLKQQIRMKPGDKLEDHLSKSLQAEMEAVRSDLTQLHHLRSAAPYWRKMLAVYQAQVPVNQGRLINEVRQEISRLNQRMMEQLDEIAENNELIEVEILNGASEDLIWQNANPKQAERVRGAKIRKMNSSADKVWNWGSTQGGFEGGGEIWEDEAGSLSADMYDNCNNKEKYSGV